MLKWLNPKEIVTIRNLTTTSTFRGILQAVLAASLHRLSPDDQARAANAILNLIGSALDIITYCSIGLAALNIADTEKKGDTVITSAPVTITTPTEITTTPKG